MDAPTIIGATQDGKAKVYWADVPGAVEYEYRIGADGVPVKTFKTYAIAAAEVGRVQVRALGAEGASAWVPAVPASAPADAPSVPDSAPPVPTPPSDTPKPKAPAEGGGGSD